MMRKVLFKSALRTCPALMVLLPAAIAGASDTGVPDRHPVYVGAQACARCHAGKDAGHQFSLWRASEHAKAYACLWSPESKKIAELSGIPEEPQEAAMCLGCHATAANAEEWEKEDTFRLEDGVQCELCHGPGSEYMAAEVMMDREKAMRAGLRMPNEQLCMVCHNVKGSHVAIVGSAEFNMKMGLEAIAHHTRKGAKAPDAELSPHPALGHGRPGTGNPHKYTGSAACGRCHAGPMMNYQFSKWRLGKHARAYAVLGTPLGYQMAAQAGVRGNPQLVPKCLRCHTTGAMADTGAFCEGFDPTDGVQCEACHGPGSEYSPEAIMRDPRAAAQAGMLPVGEATCRPCHENAHGRSFNYAMAVKAIAHSDAHARAGAPCPWPAVQDSAEPGDHTERPGALRSLRSIRHGHRD